MEHTQKLKQSRFGRLSSLIRWSSAITAIVVLSPAASAGTYTETFETAPPTGFAALDTSPYGLTWDFYAGRAYTRLAGQPNLIVVGSGDEGFYWGNNSFLPHPLYGEPGTNYADDDLTSYILNGYGTGYGGTGQGNPWTLGVDFTNGPTHVYSADFSYASGSNAPTHDVELVGLLGGVVQWTSSSALNYGHTETVLGGSGLIDRLEIIRQQNITPLFSSYPLAWYTMDNLTFDASGANGGYTWHNENAYTYNWTPVPEPLPILSFAIGGVLFAWRRRRAKA